MARKARLDALGFEWQSPGQSRPPQNHLPKDSISLWEMCHARLVEFKSAHGHLNVAAVTPQDRALMTWVREQRMGYAYGRLHFDQITRLEKLGFSWAAPRPVRET